jgi:hypothetical protein
MSYVLVKETFISFGFQPQFQIADLNRKSDGCGLRMHILLLHNKTTKQ